MSAEIFKPWSHHLMFGIGISELVVIFLVALLVLGPDQLPKVARKLAQLLGEFRKLNEDLRLNLMGSTNDIVIQQAKEVELFLKNPASNLESAVARGQVVEAELIALPSASLEEQKEGKEING